MAAEGRDIKGWVPTLRPIIFASANKLTDGTLLIGVRHWDTLMHQQFIAKYGEHARKRDALHRLARWFQDKPELPPGDDFEGQGFIDQFGRWYSREEAWQLARQNGQCIIPDHQITCWGFLHSEDVW